jgi:broad specificity phosphatase PhoE
LVRHGETEWNAQGRYQGQSDVPLSAVGWGQAERVAHRLTREKVEAIYASDLKRAWETAEIIGNEIGVEIVPEPRLRELNFGVFEGLTFDEAQARYPAMAAAWLGDPNRPPEGGESLAEFTGRIASLLADLKTRHDGGTVLLVAHGGPLGELLRLSFGLPPDGRWYFEMANASLSEIALFEGQVLLKRLNDTCHLQAGRV